MSPSLKPSPVSKPVQCPHILHHCPAPLLFCCCKISAMARRHICYSWSTTVPWTDSAQHLLLTISWHTDFHVLSWAFHGCIAYLNFVQLQIAISRLSANLMSRQFQPHYCSSHWVANDAKSVLDRASVTLRRLPHYFNLRSRPPQRCLIFWTQSRHHSSRSHILSSFFLSSLSFPGHPSPHFFLPTHAFLPQLIFKQLSRSAR